MNGIKQFLRLEEDIEKSSELKQFIDAKVSFHRPYIAQFWVFYDEIW